jgi:hypothetical protein
MSGDHPIRAARLSDYRAQNRELRAHLAALMQRCAPLVTEVAAGSIADARAAAVRVERVMSEVRESGLLPDELWEESDG